MSLDDSPRTPWRDHQAREERRFDRGIHHAGFESDAVAEMDATDEHQHLEPAGETRGFAVFGSRDAVQLDELLSQIPVDVEPQDVTLQLQLRGAETEVVASWEDPR